MLILLKTKRLFNATNQRIGIVNSLNDSNKQKFNLMIRTDFPWKIS